MNELERKKSRAKLAVIVADYNKRRGFNVADNLSATSFAAATGKDERPSGTEPKGSLAILAAAVAKTNARKTGRRPPRG